MTIQDLIRLTRRRFVTILACLVVGVLAAALALFLIPKTYTATANAYVSVRVIESDNASTGNFFSASQLANHKAQAFASLLSSATVAEGVANKLGLGVSPTALASRVSARSVQNVSTIIVSASAASPAEARAIAEAVIEVASEELKELDCEASPVTLELLSSADLSTVASSPAPRRTYILGLLGGLVVGYGIALLKTLLDRHIRVTEDVERSTEVPRRRPPAGGRNRSGEPQGRRLRLPVRRGRPQTPYESEVRFRRRRVEGLRRLFAESGGGQILGRLQACPGDGRRRRGCRADRRGPSSPDRRQVLWC